MSLWTSQVDSNTPLTLNNNLTMTYKTNWNMDIEEKVQPFCIKVAMILLLLVAHQDPGWSVVAEYPWCGSQTHQHSLIIRN